MADHGLHLDKYSKQLAQVQADWNTYTASTVSLNGNTIQWRNIGGEELKKRQDLDMRRNIKTFAHFARMFCERFPNWQIEPDAERPFTNLVVVHKTRKYKIESMYPMNELKLWGAPSEFQDRAVEFSERYNIPQPPVVAPQVFFGWALGMEDVPDYIKE